MLADVPMYDANSEGGMSPTNFNPDGPQRKAPAYMFNSSEDGSDGEEEMMQGLSISGNPNPIG